MSTNLRQKLKDLNKQKEEFDEDNQNVEIPKTHKTLASIQLKKAPTQQAVLYPRTLNSEVERAPDTTIIEQKRREQEFNADMQRECGENARWKQIQENTFTRWANERLKSVGRHIDDLQTDLSDGLNLISLMEILVSKKLPRYNHRPLFRSQKLENVSVVLDYLENVEKRRLVNIDATDIVDGNIKLILGLMWTLILHYSISLPAWEIPNQTISDKNLQPKQKLLQWLKAKLSDYLNINNFTSDWNDGRAIGAVVDACCPGLFPEWVEKSPENALENAREAMEIAEKWLGVPQLIQPHEMISSQVDEQSMMTYLSQYPNAKIKSGAPIKSQKKTHLVHCYGSGLENKSLSVDNPVIFHVETRSAGHGEVDVIVVNPHGQTEDCSVEFRGDIDQTYDCVFYPTFHGEYKIFVSFNGEQIEKSPLIVDVEFPSDKEDQTDCEITEKHASPIDEPEYENLMETKPISYDRLEAEPIPVTNLDEEENEEIFFAHATNIGSIHEHQIRRQISTRSISDPTLNKNTFFSPIKPPRTYCHDDQDDEDLETSPLVYSLTDYRLKQKRIDFGEFYQAPAVHSTQIGTANSASSLSIEENQQENQRFTSKWLIADEIQRLSELSKRETSTLTQTSHALKCCANDPHAALSDKKIECERVIFMARQKLTSFNSEIKRLESMDPRAEYYSSDISHSTLILQDIRLAIKEDYLRSLRKGKETKFYFFMCAVHYRSQILFSHMVSSFDTLQSNGQIIFSNRMIIREVESHFAATIGVYCMEITMKHPITGLDQSPLVCPHHHVASSNNNGQCLQCDKQRLNTSVSIPGQHSKSNTMIRVSNFFQVDAITIRKEDLKAQEFPLSISSASIPLKNKLHVKLQRLSELKIRKAGFLTIYSDVSGSGVWLRRWFTLTNEQNLRYWSSPEDEEANAPPSGEIELQYCIDQNVNVLQRETCARPHTFELRVAVPSRRSFDNGSTIVDDQENQITNSIIAQPFGKRTLFRYWLSADSKEDRNDWSSILNQILADLREWEIVN